MPPASLAAPARSTRPADSGRALAPSTVGRAPGVEATARPETVLDRAADDAARAALGSQAAGAWSAAAAPEAADIGEAPDPFARRGGVAGAPRLVDDGAAVGHGQMRKTAFMAALRRAVCASVDQGLRGTGRDSSGCPWVEHWLGYYADRSAEQIERALLRYAPEAAAAATAERYVALVATRVGHAAEHWAASGEISGLPDDMPGGGPAIAALGGVFFKAWPGGPRPADPSWIGAALGSGQPLSGTVRARMEGVFGTSLGGVRLHADPTAARVSQRLHAHAFAIGPHVAFAEGEFQPGTPAGDALLAHELAHVVQQGSADGGSVRARRTALDGHGASAAAEHDADRAAGGAVTALWGSPGALRARVAPRVRSGLQLRRCASKPKTPTTAAVARKLTPREERDQSIETAGERLRDVNMWITAQEKLQGLPDIKGVLGLDAAQTTNVQTAIGLLERALTLYGGKAVEGLPAALDAILNALRDAKKWSGVTDGDTLDQYEGQLKVTQALGQAAEASERATAIVASLEQVLDAGDVRVHADAIAKTVDGIRNKKLDLFDGTEEVKRHVKDAKAALGELRSRFEATPKSIGRILFVLRSFLALNAPGRVAAPTAAEAAAYAGSLDEIGHDFSVVFAKGLVTRGFDALSLYANVLGRQLAERQKMQAAKVTPASPVPSQGNAEDYFASLKDKSNAEVFAAYRAYAAAFFYHRHVDKFDDMNVSGVSELYTRPLSVFGLRPLVCTGHALLGSHLLQKANAAFVAFTVAVRAEDTDIVQNRISAGHALAKLRRKGQVFWVSNGIIVNSENDGIGPDAVAWEKSTAPLHKTSGSTIPGTNARLQQILGERADRIRAGRTRRR